MYTVNLCVRMLRRHPPTLHRASGSRCAPLARRLCVASRPTIDDAIAISFGRRAKARGTGSRGVPHRLNQDERGAYDRGRRKGFVEMQGSGWRKERGDSTLRNSWRLLCDAAALPAIIVHKGKGLDEVVIDLSPLRLPEEAFASAVAACLEVAPDGLQTLDSDSETPASEAQRALPIFQLPARTVAWERPRNEAKALAKALADAFNTPTIGPKMRRKRRGDDDDEGQ